jgi:hypothetical protein
MNPHRAIMGTTMDLSEKNRLSPYEFDLTAESAQVFYTYGQPFSAALPDSGMVSVPVVGLERPEALRPGVGGVLQAPESTTLFPG